MESSIGWGPVLESPLYICDSGVCVYLRWVAAVRGTRWSTLVESGFAAKFKRSPHSSGEEYPFVGGADLWRAVN